MPASDKKQKGESSRYIPLETNLHFWLSHGKRALRPRPCTAL